MLPTLTRTIDGAISDHVSVRFDDLNLSKLIHTPDHSRASNKKQITIRRFGGAIQNSFHFE
jgi:hypothetical protein